MYRYIMFKQLSKWRFYRFPVRWTSTIAQSHQKTEGQKTPLLTGKIFMRKLVCRQIIFYDAHKSSINDLILFERRRKIDEEREGQVPAIICYHLREKGKDKGHIFGSSRSLCIHHNDDRFCLVFFFSACVRQMIATPRHRSVEVMKTVKTVKKK